jgi:hypothetical protein
MKVITKITIVNNRTMKEYEFTAPHDYCLGIDQSRERVQIFLATRERHVARMGERLLVGTFTCHSAVKIEWEERKWEAP